MLAAVPCGFSGGREVSPMLMLLVIVEPIVSFVLGSLALLGVLAAFFFTVDRSAALSLCRDARHITRPRISANRLSRAAACHQRVMTREVTSSGLHAFTPEFHSGLKVVHPTLSDSERDTAALRVTP